MALSRMFAQPQIDGMHTRLESVARGLGVPFSPRQHAPSTKPALAISVYARRQGRLAAWRDAAMNAHWRDGRDIEDRQVLRELAVQADLDADEALGFLDSPEVPQLLADQRAEAHNWGVSGIPTWFMLPDGWLPEHGMPETGPKPVRVVGCQPMEVVEQAAAMAGARLREEP